FFNGDEKLLNETKAYLSNIEEDRAIYLVNPPNSTSATILNELNSYGKVQEVGHIDPVRNAIEFAGFFDASTNFGWRTTGATVDGAKRLLVAPQNDWRFALIGTQFFSGGVFGPMLITPETNKLPAALEKFYFSIQPDWWITPAEGPFNHSWILGNIDFISYPVQSRINFLQEIRNYENLGDQGVSGLEAMIIVWYALAVSSAIWVWFHLTSRMFQLSPFMKLSWVLLMLVLGPIGLWTYYTCYRGYGHQVASGNFPRPRWVQTLAATCSTIGYGMPTMIATAFILTFFGLPLFLSYGPFFALESHMAQSVFWSYLAAILVNAFVFVPLMLAFKENSSYWDTVKANWLTVVISMTAISLGMMSAMWWIMMEYLVMMPEEENLLWWGSMYAANVVGLFTGYIGNWLLIIRGEKKGRM
ncbi:MAG: DUF4396 domain-containing protein, partial [Bacillota bacterium]|nr:DUF4396 domain-containing protein [Bacillota bacterium]